MNALFNRIYTALTVHFRRLLNRKSYESHDWTACTPDSVDCPVYAFLGSCNAVTGWSRRVAPLVRMAWSHELTAQSDRGCVVVRAAGACLWKQIYHGHHAVSTEKIHAQSHGWMQKPMDWLISGALNVSINYSDTHVHYGMSWINRAQWKVNILSEEGFRIPSVSPGISYVSWRYENWQNAAIIKAASHLQHEKMEQLNEDNRMVVFKTYFFVNVVELK